MSYKSFRWPVFLLTMLSLLGLLLFVGQHQPVSAEVNQSELNLLQNGDFSDGDNFWWQLGDISSDTTSGAMCITINTDGANPWDIQLGQNDLTLQDGVEYRIKFRAQASSDRNISFKTGDTVTFGNYTYHTEAISTMYSEIEVTYIQSGDDSTAQFAFHLGGEGTGEVCLDDVVLEAVAPSLIVNGDFSDGDNNWDVSLNGDGAATLDTTSGAGCMNITNGSDAAWHVQLQQFNLNLIENNIYQIQFDVQADADRNISYKTGQSVAPFGDYTYQTVAVTTEWETITVSYTQSVDDATALFQFQLGGEGTGVVCFDNVSITVVGTPPPGDDNLILNGDFADGDENWNVSLNEGGEGTLDTTSGAGCVDITNGSDAVWHVQLEQVNLNLVRNNIYQIQFDAQASTERDITYKTGESTPPFVEYAVQTIPITTNWETVTYSYTQPIDDPTAFFQFQLGGQGTGQVCFDNISITVIGTIPSGAGDNLIVNPDFEEGLEPWQLQIGAGAATVDTDSGAGCVNITDAGSNQWDIVFNQGNINLKGDTDYQIMFDVMADSEREFFYKTGSTSFKNYTYQSAQATTEWSTVSITYTQSVTDSASIFEFQVAARGTGEICFDNVLLAEMAPPLTRDIVRNGSFDDGTDSWTFFTQNGALLEPVIYEGELMLSVVQTGTNDFDAMLWQLYLPVGNGYDYSLRFDARADIGDDEIRTIFAKVGKHNPNYDTYGGGDVELTNAMQSFQFDFTMNHETDVCGKIELHVSQDVGDIYVDNVQLLTNAPEVITDEVADYTTASTSNGLALRELAEAHGIKLGAATDTPTFRCNPLHNDVFSTEFNGFTPSNAMKMGPLVPVRDQYQWDDADAMVDYAQENGMEFHGHAFVWHYQMPGWADRYDITRTEMIDIMYNHIDTVATRYQGQIAVWDVVNEAIDDETFGLRLSPWSNNIGDDYLDLAFHRAREADPNAQLLYNDYVISEMGRPKADAAFDLVERMVNDGVPIDGVGFQMHWQLPDGANVQAVKENMARYNEIGIDVYMTEIDVRIPNTMTHTIDNTGDALAVAAQLYADMLQACVDAPNCKHYTTWGISDLDSWIPSAFPGFGRAHLFDEEFNAKPAYHALIDVLDNIVVTPATPLMIAESGTPQTVTLTFPTAPTDTVTITLEATSPACTVSPEEVVVTTTTWEEPIVVTVTPVDNDEVNDDQTCLITTVAASADTRFNDTDAVADIEVLMTDDDAPTALFVNDINTQPSTPPDLLALASLMLLAYTSLLLWRRKR